MRQLCIPIRIDMRHHVHYLSARWCRQSLTEGPVKGSVQDMQKIIGAYYHSELLCALRRCVPEDGGHRTII
eukprot:38849-Eustigmatos_ZCMA.PRE.1